MAGSVLCRGACIALACLALTQPLAAGTAGSRDGEKSGWRNGHDSLPLIPPSHHPAVLSSRPPGSELTISLMTMGIGERVWERFGHNAILVEDRARGTAQAYNYGMFDFRQKNFLLNFIKGRMWYWMQGFGLAPTLDIY